MRFDIDEIIMLYNKAHIVINTEDCIFTDCDKVECGRQGVLIKYIGKDTCDLDDRWWCSSSLTKIDTKDENILKGLM